MLVVETYPSYYESVFDYSGYYDLNVNGTMWIRYELVRYDGDIDSEFLSSFDEITDSGLMPYDQTYEQQGAYDTTTNPETDMGDILGELGFPEEIINDILGGSY